MTEEDQIRALSLKARLAICLHCLESYCTLKRLEHTAIDGFLDYYWRAIEKPRFEDWFFISHHEGSRELLFVRSAQDDLKPDFVEFLQSHQVPVAEFHALLCNTAEIIENSMFTEVDEAGSRANVMAVLSLVRAAGVTPPDLSKFANSPFERKALGRPLSTEEFQVWRQ